MKKAIWIFTGILMMAISFSSQAQQIGDFFIGKWKVIGNSPMGEVTFIVQLDRVDGVLAGDIQREGEAEPVKISKIVENDDEITIYFLSSSGYDVDMNMKKKDDNNISGWAMGSYSVAGERMN